MKIDRTKLYPPLEAIKLAQETATNHFDGKIEVHAVLKRAGKYGEYKTEKKAPLIHAVLGKQSETAEKLAEELAKLVAAVDANQIVKLAVCATMGPGVKVDVKP